MELLVKNGFVYDPINGVNGEKMDIAIRDGKIVEEVNERKARKIDASGMVVMPGGVDIHCHIAGSEVNTGRLLRPEDHFRDFEPKNAYNPFWSWLLDSIHIHNWLPLCADGLHHNNESFDAPLGGKAHA